jgi:hypothetical protein
MGQATLQSGWRVFAGSLVLLIVSYLIYFVRARYQQQQLLPSAAILGKAIFVL